MTESLTTDERLEVVRQASLLILEATKLNTQGLEAEIKARTALEKRVAFLEKLLGDEVVIP